MVDYREIIRFKSTKLEMSNTMIASSVGSSRNTVSEVLKLVQEKGLSWPVPAALTNRDLEQILYPERTRREGRLMPNYEYVYNELAKPNVTLTLLWAEYCAKCEAAGAIPYQHTHILCGESHNMWVYRTGKGYGDTPIILYEYQKTRKADHPRKFLKEFTGVVVCDGYSAYRKLDRETEAIVFAGCWTHAGRYFADALKVLPKKEHEAAKDTVAYEAIKRIGAIYHLDNQLAELKPDDRRKQRQINLKPLVEAFFAWAKEIRESGRLTKGKTLEGINYCINQEEALKVFLDDGEVPLDNNATEGALRSFCLHKHAWKLIDSIDGAKSSAIVYSITETAKANNLNPFRYLEYVLTVMKDHQEDTDYRFMEDLLPWSEQLPEICRSKTKTTNV